MVCKHFYDLLKNEAKKANHVQVVEEDRRKHLPSNWEAKQARMRWEEEEDAFRAECAKKGVDVDRAKNLNISAELVNRLELRKRRKRPHLSVEDEAGDVVGFTSYADASHKKYLKQTKAIKPDLVAYQKQKERLWVSVDSTFCLFLLGNFFTLSYVKCEQPFRVMRRVVGMSGCYLK